MATESVAVRASKLASGKDQEELRILLAALLAGLQMVTAKLDADAGVTDTNYTALLAAIVTQ